jgi:DNA-binding transcriptional MerR regulator
MSNDSPSNYRIGELAKCVSKTVRTIHFYEELGLLRPAERSPGGFRMYNDQAVDRIHWIERLQELGFSLSDIKQFLADFHAHSTGPQSMGALRSFYGEKLSETQAAIQRLQNLEAELNASIAYLKACTTCSMTESVHACASCTDSQHSDSEAPRMVATIAAPA